MALCSAWCCGKFMGFFKSWTSTSYTRIINSRGRGIRKAKLTFSWGMKSCSWAEEDKVVKPTIDKEWKIWVWLIIQLPWHGSNMIEAHLSDKTVTVILILNVVPKYLQDDLFLMVNKWKFQKRTWLWITKAEVLTTHRINGKYTDKNFEAIRAMRNPLTSQVNIWFALPTSSPSKSSSSQNSCKLSYIFFHLWSICIDSVQSSFSFSTSVPAAAAEPCCWNQNFVNTSYRDSTRLDRNQ